MNYGRQGIKQKKKLLNSAATRLRTKLGVFAIKFILILAIAVVVSGSCLVLGSVQGIISSAPEVSTIDVSPDGFATKIYDNESNEIQTLSTTGSNRISVELDVVPLELQHAFVAIEDERFYEHNGIDIRGIIRAGYNTITGGGLSQGASTLTQQLLKNNVFNAYNETDIEKIKRKVQEQYLAIKLETYMSKDDILENYLNTRDVPQCRIFRKQLLRRSVRVGDLFRKRRFRTDFKRMCRDCFHYTESDQVKPVKVSGRQSGTTAEGFAQYAQARLHYTGRV